MGEGGINEVDLAQKLLSVKGKKYSGFDPFVVRKKKIATFRAGRGFLLNCVECPR